MMSMWRIGAKKVLVLVFQEKFVDMFFSKLPVLINFPKLSRCYGIFFGDNGFFKQLEQEMETVVNVLKPGPLGIIEHKFSAEEVRKGKVTVEQAIYNWKMNASLEKNDHFGKNVANQESHK